VRKTYDFEESLKKSKSYEDSPFWDAMYKEHFQNLATAVPITEDGWAQRAGIDRLLVLKNGKVLTVDEKIREKDYDDFLIEDLSSLESNTPGWINTATVKSIDLAAYMDQVALGLTRLHGPIRVKGSGSVMRAKVAHALGVSSEALRKLGNQAQIDAGESDGPHHADETSIGICPRFLIRFFRIAATVRCVLLGMLKGAEPELKRNHFGPGKRSVYGRYWSSK
jgi:hypothetical protein